MASSHVRNKGPGDVTNGGGRRPLTAQHGLTEDDQVRSICILFQTQDG